MPTDRSSAPPVQPPGRTRTTSPRKPMATPRTVDTCGRCPVTRRNTTTHSGIEATISAASPDGMSASESVTPPMPMPSRRKPSSALAASSRRVTASAERPRRTVRIVGEDDGREQQPAPGPEQRRERLDEDRDPEVGRSPDQVDGDQPGPDLGGARFLVAAAGRRSALTRWDRPAGSRTRGSPTPAAIGTQDAQHGRGHHGTGEGGVAARLARRWPCRRAGGPRSPGGWRPARSRC